MKEKHVKVRYFPFLGHTKIWVKHDRRMGECSFTHDGREFTTPNMPKLRYAFDETIFMRTGQQVVKKELIGKKFILTEKKDGFNLVFWTLEHSSRTLIFPKTRMLPYARGSITRIISHPMFPRMTVRRILKEYTDVWPVFEVYGRILDIYNILHGPVQYDASSPFLKLALIGLIRRDTRDFITHREYPRGLVELIKSEDAFELPVLGEIEVTEKNLPEMAALLDDINEKKVISEGYVLVSIERPVKMWKVKPPSIMKRDMMMGITEEMIERELSKILLEQSPLEAAQSFQDVINEVADYLREDIRIRKSHIKTIARIAAERLAVMLRQQGYDTPEKMGRAGVHKIIIGTAIRMFGK